MMHIIGERKIDGYWYWDVEIHHRNGDVSYDTEYADQNQYPKSKAHKDKDKSR